MFIDIIAAPPAASITTPIWVLVASIAIPFLGTLATAWVTNRSNAKQSRVSEREANTHEMDMILDGFKEGMSELRTELQEQKKRSEGQIEKLEARVARLESENSALINQNTEQHNHIVALEALIPNPPGVPLRPIWSRIPTQQQQENEQNEQQSS
jgi:hypothetical protein